MSSPPTLADLLRVGHGPDMLAIDVDARLRCRRCGGKGGETRISVRDMPRLTKLGDDR
jgi:hypothetical protein